MKELWYAFVRWWDRPSKKQRLLNALEEIADNTHSIQAYLEGLHNYEGRRNTREQTMYQAWQDMQEPDPMSVPTPVVHEWNGIPQSHPVTLTYSTEDIDEAVAVMEQEDTSHVFQVG
jgi:hypothetical protein